MNFRLLKKPFFLVLFMTLPALVLFKFSGQSLVALLGVFALSLSGVSYLFKWDKYILFALVSTLFFSVDLPILGGSNLAIPAEPLAVVLAGSSIVALILDKAWREKLSSLLSIKILLLFALVFLVTSFYSSIPKVSYKYISVWITYTLTGLSVFRLLHYKEIDLDGVLKILAICLLVLGLFSIYNLLPYGFNLGAAGIMAKPFFKDHTVFSATVSMFSPLLIFWPMKGSKAECNFYKAIGVFLIFIVLISSSRAAWLSLIASFSVYAVILFKVKRVYLIGTAIVSLVLVFSLKNEITNAFMVNPYQSSNAVSSLEDQALSVANVSSDPSNMERLNRWKSAWRMFTSKPVLGYGPGTYQFQYFPFQRDEDMTYISVTSPFLNKQGRGGSAHSEYLLLLSESGVFSFVLWLVFLGWVAISTKKRLGTDGLVESNKKQVAVFLGLFTYVIHALFNNFMNVAVFGIAFWILVFVLIHLISLMANNES